MADCPALPPPGRAETVLSFDVVDAYAPRTPPLLEIDSDGGIAVRKGDEIRRGQMTRAELQRLLEEIVSGQGLLSIDGAAIRRTLEMPERSGQVFAVADAPSSFLTLSLPDCSHSVTVMASAFASLARPDIAPLQRFRQIELRLLEIVTALQDG